MPRGQGAWEHGDLGAWGLGAWDPNSLGLGGKVTFLIVQLGTSHSIMGVGKREGAQAEALSSVPSTT